jgi:Flp pilus assembly CpaE family ATPase
MLDGEDAVDQVPRVVLALEAQDVVEEVMHFLDRSGRARVVATASDDRQLAEALRQLEPEVVVAEPALLDARPAAGVVLALDTRESVASLRAAIRAGASGYFVWPAEREELVGAAAAAMRAVHRAAGRARVIAVHGGRGGVGVTFVATHLAAALARRGSVILLDLDPVFADVAHALDAPADDGDRPVHTLADAVSLGDDLGPEQLEAALWEHASGVRVLLPPPPEESVRLGPTELEPVVEAACGAVDIVLLHLPRGLDAIASSSAARADRLLEVLTLDVGSFRATSRALEALAPMHLEERLGLVVNRAARAEVTVGDVDRVFGRPPIAVFPSERSVRASNDRGRLVPARSRMARRFDRLAGLVAPAEIPEPSRDGPLPLP